MTYEHHYDNPHLALWMRVVLYAHDHDDQDLELGQLRSAIDPLNLVRPAEISRAIQRARAAGILTPTSSAARLTIVQAGTTTAAS